MDTLISVLISLGALLTIVVTLLANSKIPKRRQWVRLVQCVLMVYISVAYALDAVGIMQVGILFSTVVRPCWMLLLLSLTADRFILWRQSD